MTTIQRLKTGYTLVRWNANQWIQWPAGREATLQDGFGWITQEMVDEANTLAQAEKGG